jgi:galactokinase/mevalonate kinase-like predicted kinase
MAIWTKEIKEIEKLYASLKGQLPDLEKELERFDIKREIKEKISNNQIKKLWHLSGLITGLMNSEMIS